MSAISHHTIRQSILARIHAGEWGLGERMPGEIDLAEEYGCARTTINRALQALAKEGLVVRKRKGGTRVRETPLRQAKFEIPVLREQVEMSGGVYSHTLLTKRLKIPPAEARNRLRMKSGAKALYLETLHLADGQPYAFETRWINTAAVPNILEAPLDRISANEWLVQTVPFSSGDVAFSAVNADKAVANAINTDIGAAIFLIERTTWLEDEFITTMKLYFKQGYQLYAQL